MIDYGFEERLVDRIAVREAIAARLTPRQKRILCRLVRYGETYREIGEREGRSYERIRQIHSRTVKKLTAGLRVRESLEPKSLAQTTRDTPPPGFDRAEFLRHMQGLILRREREEQERLELERIREEAERKAKEEYARNWRKKERESLDRIMRNEEAQGLFDPPPPPKPPPTTPRIRLPVQYTVHPAPPPSHYVYNSPSYAPPPLPTRDELSNMAMRALQYLLQIRPQYYTGTPWLGKWATSVVFTRDGGSVTEAINSIVVELPDHARLSAYPVPIEDKVLGANATTSYASLRVTVTPDGLKLRFDVTWD